MEKAEQVGLKLLLHRLVALNLGQARDVMALKTRIP
jgi:hypothetical protein